MPPFQKFLIWFAIDTWNYYALSILVFPKIFDNDFNVLQSTNFLFLILKSILFLCIKVENDTPSFEMPIINLLKFQNKF